MAYIDLPVQVLQEFSDVQRLGPDWNAITYRTIVGIVSARAQRTAETFERWRRRNPERWREVRRANKRKARARKARAKKKRERDARRKAANPAEYLRKERERIRAWRARKATVDN